MHGTHWSVKAFEKKTLRLCLYSITHFLYEAKWMAFCFGLQVPPDFYIPDFDEDEQNPDERVHRKLDPSSWHILHYYFLNFAPLDSECCSNHIFQSTLKISRFRGRMNITMEIMTMTIWMYRWNQSNLPALLFSFCVKKDYFSLDRSKEYCNYIPML